MLQVLQSVTVSAGETVTLQNACPLAFGEYCYSVTPLSYRGVEIRERVGARIHPYPRKGNTPKRVTL